MRFPFVQNAKTLKEVLDLKEDPEANFSENTRKVHEAMCKKRKKEFAKHEKSAEKRRQEWVALAEKVGALMTCQCCFADDCLEEEMLPCQVRYSYWVHHAFKYLNMLIIFLCNFRVVTCTAWIASNELQMLPLVRAKPNSAAWASVIRISSWPPWRKP